MNDLHHKIFQTKEDNFESIALDVFQFQYNNLEVYKAYCDFIKKDISNVKTIQDIPFLPISFFKTHQLLIGKQYEEIFTSSGTTGNNTSKHYVKDIEIYEKSFTTAFEHFYDKIENYTFFALLPAYLERKGSSLIYMVNNFIEKSGKGGFYLYNHNQLVMDIKEAKKRKEKIILFGVSFALLDLAAQHSINLSDDIIIETGGMKGRKKEMLRSELHTELKNAFTTENIHSEYGMTELLSQAYSDRNELFKCPPWMKILIRVYNDPFSYEAVGKTGAINIIDLANLYSCSFIETQDLGKLHTSNQFEILGRMDLSDLRGCNLLVQ